MHRPAQTAVGESQAALLQGGQRHVLRGDGCGDGAAVVRQEPSDPTRKLGAVVRRLCGGFQGVTRTLFARCLLTWLTAVWACAALRLAREDHPDLLLRERVRGNGGGVAVLLLETVRAGDWTWRVN